MVEAKLLSSHLHLGSSIWDERPVLVDLRHLSVRSVDCVIIGIEWFCFRVRGIARAVSEAIVSIQCPWWMRVYYREEEERGRWVSNWVRISEKWSLTWRHIGNTQSRRLLNRINNQWIEIATDHRDLIDGRIGVRVNVLIKSMIIIVTSSLDVRQLMWMPMAVDRGLFLATEEHYQNDAEND